MRDRRTGDFKAVDLSGGDDHIDPMLSFVLAEEYNLSNAPHSDHSNLFSIQRVIDLHRMTDHSEMSVTHRRPTYRERIRRREKT